MTGPGARLAELRVALALLTRLPVGQLPDPVPSLATARWAFPLIGLPVGLMLWAVIAASVSLGLPALAAALLGLTATILMTGALHEDGLADTADGLGGGATRERKLGIMRDSRIGSYGVLALILILALKATALASLAASPLLLPACLAIGALSRLAMTALLVLLPPARSDGLGAAADGGPSGLAPAVALTLLLLIPLILTGTTAAALAAAATLIATTALASLTRRQIGGHTGDILGATQQLSETAAWLALAAMLAP